MTEQNAGFTQAAIYHQTSTADSQMRTSGQRKRKKGWDEGEERNAEAWIMERVWYVYPRSLQNYSHFAAFNQWLSVYILIPLCIPPRLAPTMLFHSGVTGVVICCAQIYKTNIRYAGEEEKQHHKFWPRQMCVYAYIYTHTICGLLEQGYSTSGHHVKIRNAPTHVMPVKAVTWRGYGTHGFFHSQHSDWHHNN